MNDNCITRFEVSNFKKFDHLVVENMGQVNLITGDNNVGKTTLLEALLVFRMNSFWIKYLHQTLDRRQINLHLDDIHSASPKFPSENFLKYIFNDLQKKLECKYHLKSGITKEQGLEYRQLGDIDQKLMATHRKDHYKIFNVPDWVLFYKDGKIDEIQWVYCDDMDRSIPSNLYMPLITFNGLTEGDPQRMVDSLTPDEKEFVISSLKGWVPDISDFDFGKVGSLDLARLATNKNNTYHAITTFGDGVQKVFWHLVEIIYAGRSGQTRMMIDEIDTGVHYLRLKEFLKTIFDVAKKRGIQIFATTHSMDCIKAFVEAGEEVTDIKNDLRLIELEEFTTKDGLQKHTTTTYDHDVLKFKLETDTNVRGGDVWR